MRTKESKWSDKRKLEYIYKSYRTATKKLRLFNLKETPEQFNKKNDYNRLIYSELMEELEYVLEDLDWIERHEKKIMQKLQRTDI